MCPEGDVGLIAYPERACQVVDWSGIRVGRATPSDIDGILELENKAWFVFELKHTSAPKWAPGSRLAFERMIDDFQKAGKYSICIRARHNVPAQLPIVAEEAEVVEYRFRGEWRKPKECGRLLGPFFYAVMAHYDKWKNR